MYLFCASNSLNLAPCFLPVSVPSPANNGLIVGLAFTNSDSGIMGSLVSIGFVTLVLSNNFDVSSIACIGALLAVAKAPPSPPDMSSKKALVSFTICLPTLPTGFNSLAPDKNVPVGDNTSPTS